MIVFLICFDMDGTLLNGETLEILAEEVGRLPEVQELTALAMAGQLEFARALKLRLAMLRGLPLEKIEEIAKKLPLRQGAFELIKELKQADFQVVMLTGGFEPLAKIIAARLEIDEYYANNLEVINGRLTGKFELKVTDNKHLLMRKIAERITARLVIAVGDGANDIKMLKEADLGIGFRAKEVIKKQITCFVDEMDELAGLLRKRGLL